GLNKLNVHLDPWTEKGRCLRDSTFSVASWNSCRRAAEDARLPPKRGPGDNAGNVVPGTGNCLDRFSPTTPGKGACGSKLSRIPNCEEQDRVRSSSRCHKCCDGGGGAISIPSNRL